MSKPLGMDVNFRIIKPTAVEDKVWDAVELAIDNGWTPKRMIAEVKDCWREYLADKSRDDMKSFERLSK